MGSGVLVCPQKRGYGCDFFEGTPFLVVVRGHQKETDRLEVGMSFFEGSK